MNLVQINERLKDMPLRAVEMYANGSNPEIPPYLALAELQRREKFAQQASIERGAAQGPMPSIKEQIEQKVGLMALQQGRMQQGQQQMADQATRMPMSVPQNVESAEEQPQAENSGIARLPVKNDMYQFASGGIVAFNGEDQSYVMSPEEIQNLSTREAMMEALRRNNEIITAENLREAKRREAQERERQAKDRERQLSFLDTVSPTAAARVRGQAGSEFTAEASPTPQPSASDLQAILNMQPSGSVAARAAAPSARASAPRPAANVPPSQAQPAAPTAATTAPRPASALPEIFTDTTASNVLKESMKTKTPEEMFREQQALLKMFGLTGQAGEGLERRVKERQEQYEARRPTGLQELIRVLGQAGQYKGLSGVAPAYTAMQQQSRAEDLRFREEQDKLLDELEKARRQEATGRANAIREDILKGKDIATRSAGVITAEQMRAQADMARQKAADESAERLAGIKFDYERRLKAIPQARIPELKEQYVNDLVKNGMPRDKAIEAAMKLGTAGDRIDVEALKASAKTLNEELQRINISKERKAEIEKQLDDVNRTLMQIGGIGGGRFIVKVGDQTFGFPTQEAADKFKAQAGVK